MTAELPTKLRCAKNCPFGLQCGTMVAKEQKECIEAIGEVIEGASNLEACGNNVEVKAGGVRLARVRAGNVTEPY